MDNFRASSHSSNNPLIHQYKKNRASQSGGDRRARGIFEFSTRVGYRSTSIPASTNCRDRNLKIQRALPNNYFGLVRKSNSFHRLVSKGAAQVLTRMIQQ